MAASRPGAIPTTGRPSAPGYNMGTPTNGTGSEGRFDAWRGRAKTATVNTARRAGAGFARLGNKVGTEQQANYRATGSFDGRNPSQWKQAVAATGPTGMGVVAAVDAAKWATTPSAMGNPASWAAQHLSPESNALIYGPVALDRTRYQTRWIDTENTMGRKPLSAEEMSTGEYNASLGGLGQPQGGAGQTMVGGLPGGSTMPPPPMSGAGPLPHPDSPSDWMHKSQTSGTGTPWFDAHTQSTSGINVGAPQPIRKPTQN